MTIKEVWDTILWMPLGTLNWIIQKKWNTQVSIVMVDKKQRGIMYSIYGQHFSEFCNIY